MMETVSFCCLFWWESDLKSQEPLNHPVCPGASRGASWDAMARPHCEPTGTNGFWRTGPSPSQSRQASVFPAITPTLAGCFPKFLINEGPSSPCYLCSWLHTPPLKPEGLGYNSFYDKNEYLSIWTVATARIYFKHICSEWSHYMAQSNWYVKFPE